MTTWEQQRNELSRPTPLLLGSEPRGGTAQPGPAAAAPKPETTRAQNCEVMSTAGSKVCSRRWRWRRTQGALWHCPLSDATAGAESHTVTLRDLKNKACLISR